MHRLLGADHVPEVLKPYLDVFRAAQRPGSSVHYPGFPWLLRMMLRPGDRRVLAETGTQAINRVQPCFAGDDRVALCAESGWEVLGRWPEEACCRGLVLVDPAFDRPADYDRVARTLPDTGHRWPEGCLVLWHPLLDARHEPMTHVLCTAFPGRVLQREWRCGPRRSQGGMDGSAIPVVNPPEGFASALEHLQIWLRDQLPGGCTRILAPSGG